MIKTLLVTLTLMSQTYAVSVDIGTAKTIFNEIKQIMGPIADDVVLEFVDGVTLPNMPESGWSASPPYWSINRSVVINTNYTGDDDPNSDRLELYYNIAHEFGHAFLGHGYGERLLYKSNTPTSEAHADRMSMIILLKKGFAAQEILDMLNRSYNWDGYDPTHGSARESYKRNRDFLSAYYNTH